MDPTFPDPKSLELPARMAQKLISKRTRIPKHRKGQKFLKGPVPMDWLTRAMKLPGKSVHLSIMLWFYAGLKRCGEIAISLSRLQEVGLNRFSAAKGLAHLEKAGLVVVRRSSGRKSLVRLMDVAGEDGVSNGNENRPVQ